MQIQQVHYNARRGVYRAQIAMSTQAGQVNFPCEVAADQSMSPARVMQKMQARAAKLSQA